MEPRPTFEQPGGADAASEPSDVPALKAEGRAGQPPYPRSDEELPPPTGAPYELAGWAAATWFLTVLNNNVGAFLPLQKLPAAAVLVVSLLYCAVLLFAVMRMTQAAARLAVSSGTLLALGLALAAPMGVVLLLRSQNLVAPVWLSGTANNFFLPIGVSLLGAAIGRVIKHPNTLLAASGFALFFDVVVVTMGPVRALTQANSPLIAAVSLGAGPKIPAAAAVPSKVILPLSATTIGPADILFLALFFSSIYLLRLSWRSSFLWVYGFLLGALAVIELGLLPDWLPGIPALLPMGVAVLIANAKHQAFTRQERRDLVIGGAFAVFCAAMIVFASARTIKPAAAVTPNGDPGFRVRRMPSGVYAVLAAEPGSPAAQKGLRPGEALIAVNGTDVFGKPEPEVLKLLDDSLPKGLRLKVKYHLEEPREVTFEPIAVPAAPTSPAPSAPAPSR